MRTLRKAKPGWEFGMPVPWALIDTALFSIEMTVCGGMGFPHAKFLLEEQGIPCRKTYSQFVGHVGVEVPKEFERRADRILL